MFKYTEALKQLDSANNMYGREIGTLSTDLNNEKTRSNELINKIQNLEKTNELSSNILVDLAKELGELKNIKNKLKEDNEYLDNLVNSLRDNNSELIRNIKDINNEATRDQAKIRNMLNKVNDNINNLYKPIVDKENDFDAKLDKLDKLNNNIKKINNYIKKNNEKTNIKDLEDIGNRYNNLMNEYDTLRDIIYEYKNEIKKIKIKQPNKTKDDSDKIKNLEKKLSLQKDAINDSKYFLRIKENVIKNKKQTLSMLDRINTDEVKKIKEYDDMPYLETEEEAAENIADINERRDVRKKGNKARTFAQSDNAEKSETNKTKKIVSDSNKDDDGNKNIKIFYDDDDDIIKIFYDGDEDIKAFYDDDSKNIKIVYYDDYKINGLNGNSLD